MKRVRISSPYGTVITTQVTDAETGEEIPHVQRVEIIIDIKDKDGMVKAKIYTTGAQVDTIAEAEVIDARE